MKIQQAIAALLPNVAWTMTGSDLSTLKLPSGVVAPTQAVIDAYIMANNYRELRATAYPSQADLNDALVHQDMGDGGVALKAYYTACEAVKMKYPKPS